MYSNVTIKNVSWPHFSWATLYAGARWCSEVPAGTMWPITSVVNCAQLVQLS